MKIFLLLFALTGVNFNANAQTLISYGNDKVSKDEFLRAYNKNKTPVTDKEKALRDYLELYSNFKLKVKAAKELQLDTLPQLQTDLVNFRTQVEENYLNDEQGLQELVTQAAERSQRDLHLIHFSFPLDTLSSGDTAKAFSAINKVYNELKAGNNNYQEIANRTSSRWSDFGFITAFSLPYTYENIVYALKTAEVSKPYRSNSAWHVFKVVSDRKSAGKWKIAQILLSFPPSADEQTQIQIQKLADSIHRLLKTGDDFSALARTFSNDKLTYQNGGELAEFGTGKYDRAFEQQIFTLNKNGDISQPFKTEYGIHIVKRLGHTATADKADPAFLAELKQKVMMDSRVSVAKEKFAKDVMQKIGYKKTGNVSESELFRFTDSVVANQQIPEYHLSLPVSNKSVISFKKSSIKASEWFAFARDYKSNDQYRGETNGELWKKYQTIAALNYYRQHLAEFNPDFRYQMEEFREGNMLFEVMERNVWTKASNDSVGLLKYYNEHKEKYKWAASADVLIFSTISEKAAQSALDALTSGLPWKQVADQSNNEVQVDSARYELQQVLPTEVKVAPSAGSFLPIAKNADGTASFVKFLKLYDAGGQRSFDESRGLVINDYQVLLEQNWLNSLRKKYPVKINEAVVKTMIK